MSKAATLDFEVLKQPSTKSSTNLMTNGSAETNITGWVSLLSATLTRDTTEHFFGTASLKVVTPGAANREGAQFTTNTVPNDGNWYAISMWIKGTAGTPMEYTNTGVKGRALTGDWVRAVIVIIGSGQIVAARTAAGTTAAITFYVDGVQIEKITNPNFVETPYIDTNGSTASNTLPFGSPSPVLLPPVVRFVSATLSVVGSDSVFIGKVPSKTVAASGVSTTTLARLVSKIASLVGTSTITLARTPSHTLSVNDSGIVSIKKFPSITKSVSGTGNGLIKRVASHTLSSNSIAITTLVRLLARQLSAAGVSHEALSVLPSTTLRTNDLVNPSIRKLVTKTLTVTVLGSALIALQPLVVLMATINGVSSIIRLISRTLSTVINGSASVDNQLGRDISTLNTGTATLVKTPKIRLLAVGEGLASLTRLFIDRSEFLLRITASYTRVYAESTKRWAIDMYRRIS